jgi:hypothetical protein
MRRVQHGEGYPDIGIPDHSKKPGKAAGGSGPLGLGIQCQARADGFFPTARQLPPLVNLPPLGVQLVTMAAASVPHARATRVEC